MWEKLDGLGDAFGTGGRDVVSVAAVVVSGGANVPSIDGMRGPGAALVRWFEDEDSCARRGKWRGIEIKDAVELGVGGEAWVNVGCAQKV